MEIIIEVHLQPYNMHTHNLIGPVEMFPNNNYLDKAWDREFKRAIINIIKELMNSHTHTHQLNELKENKHLSHN